MERFTDRAPRQRSAGFGATLRRASVRPQGRPAGFGATLRRGMHSTRIIGALIISAPIVSVRIIGTLIVRMLTIRPRAYAPT